MKIIPLSPLLLLHFCHYEHKKMLFKVYVLWMLQRHKCFLLYIFNFSVSEEFDASVWG